MKSRKLYILISSIFLLSGCQNFALDKLTNPGNAVNNKDTSTDSSNSDNEASTTTYTILVYMCGSNLESENSLATANIEEMCSINLNSNINLIIETGGAKIWNTKYSISPNEIGRYKVENNRLTKIASKTKSNMGDQATLIDFVSWGMDKYPADKTALVFWNHGGAMYGCCADENFSNDALTNAEVKSALISSLGDKKLEWIGYDACLMQVQDVADYNSNFANYMVASQETEPGQGWDWDIWLNKLSENTNISTLDLLSSVADSYVQKVRDTYDYYASQFEQLVTELEETGQSGYYYGDDWYSIDQISELAKYYKENSEATCSVLDLSKMHEYKVAFEEMAEKISNSINTSEKFSQLYSNTEGFSNTTTYKCYDADDVLNNINTNYPSVGADLVLDKLTDLVIYNKVDNLHKDACGLSIFCGTVNSSETDFKNWQAITSLY